MGVKLNQRSHHVTGRPQDPLPRVCRPARVRRPVLGPNVVPSVRHVGQAILGPWATRAAWIFNDDRIQVSRHGDVEDGVPWKSCFLLMILK